MPALVGVYRGRIMSSSDPMASGRVQVTIPAVSGSNAVWAPVCSPFGAPLSVPRIGATAWVAFENGDASHPVVLGTSP